MVLKIAKSKKRQRLAWLVVIVAIALLLIIILTRTANQKAITQKEANEIRIGAIMPLTGTQAIGGEPGRNGILIALEEVNSKGGVNGRKINLVLEDSQGEPKTALTAFTKLAAVDEVPIIIGPYLSTEAGSVAPLAEKYKVLLVAPVPTTSILNTAGDYVFKLRESNDVHMEKISGVMKNLGIRNIGIIYNNNEFCVDTLRYLEGYAGKNSIKIIQKEAYEQKDTDFRAQLAKIKGSNSDGIFACGYYQDLGLVFKQINELGLKKQAFSVTALENKALFDIAGNKSVEGVIYTTSYFDCNKEAKEFCATYKKRFGREPDYRAGLTYDALYIVSKAIEEAIAESRDITPEAVQKSLLKVQNYKGLTGTTSLDKEGNARKDVMVKTVKGGRFVALS